MQIHSVGIDLRKMTSHLAALGAAGKVLVKEKFTQRQLLTYTANMQPSLIGEAGSYASVTVPVDERGDYVHSSYDKMTRLLASYGAPDALKVAQDLNLKGESLINEVCDALSQPGGAFALSL